MADFANKAGRKQIIITDPLAFPEVKGKRLKRARTLAGLSREELCTISGVNIHTLIGWECGRFGGVSRDGAQKISKSLELEGVLCDPEWILFGTGSDPDVRTNYQKIKGELDNNPNLTKRNDASSTIDELLFFKKLHENAADTKIDDDGMLPYYQLGDHVAGIKRYGDLIKTLIGLDCIVETESGLVVLRSLQQGPNSNTYNLVCKNLQSSATNKIIYDTPIVSAAPIIWIRRKDPNSCP